MKKKTSWDDIPSLDLSLDHDADTESVIDKRSAVRMVSKDILLMIKEHAKIIYVRIATAEGILPTRGALEDINQGGLCFRLPHHPLQAGQSIKIQVMIGKRLLASNARVRWTGKDKIGVQFIDLAKEDVDFLAELYSAKVLNRMG